MANSGDEAFLPFCRPWIGEEEIAEVVDTLRSDWLTTGPKTKRFEERFRESVGAGHAIAVNSCTAGLHVALASAGIGEGDEVITSPFTFCATANVIMHQRATPVFADIEEDYYTLDPGRFERAVTPRTRAVIPVHYGGQPCDMDAIRDIARRHRLLVLDDAAHAVGAAYRGTPIGNVGDVTAFSFYATKNATTGEGGMITTNDPDLAARMRVMSLHGISADAWKRYSAEGSWYYEVLVPGFKYNMTDIQAALGLHQLARLPGFIDERRRIALRYAEAFTTLDALILPTERPDVRHAWHLYPIRLRPGVLTIDRAGFLRALAATGIGGSVHVIPVHLHPFYRERFNLERGLFPVTESVYDSILSLPLFPRMTERDVTRVIDAVGDIVRRHRR